MKNFLLIITASLFLFACAPAEIPPTATPVPPTVTLPPTTTPLPTATVTATAVPTVEEKAISSCVDPELIGKVNDDFKARTGHDLNDPKDFFRSAITSLSYARYSPDNPETIAIPLFKIGVEKVQVDGVNGISQLLCFFGRNRSFGDNGDKTVGVVVGWFNAEGKFFSIAGSSFDQSEGGNEIYWGDDEVLRLWETMRDDVYVDIHIHSFAMVRDASELKTVDEWSAQGVERVRRFLSLWGQDFAERMFKGGVRPSNIPALWDELDSDIGDPGLIMDGRIVVLSVRK